MARKKSSSSPPSPIQSKNSTLNSAEPSKTSVNIKTKNSDENLTIPIEKTRKRSLVSLPTEGEEEDEFLFSRLKKQIKGHWDKIIERYPNGGLFLRPHRTHNTTDQEITRNDSVRTTQTNSSTSTTASASAIANFEQNFLSSAIKSVLLLPAFSCKRDDEGRRGVPFISSLLQVNHVFKFILNNP